MTVWIISSCAVTLAILLIRFCVGHRIDARLRYALWLIVLLRLLIPVQIGESGISTAQLDRVLPQISAEVQETIVKEIKFSYLDGNESRDEIIDYHETNDYNPYYTLSEYVAVRRDQMRSASLGIWIVGMAVTAGVLLCGNLRYYLRLRRSRVRLEESVMGIAVYRCDITGTPCLFGFPIPALYINTETLDDAVLLHHVMAHERAHLRHGDTVIAFLRCLCLVLHWYNPLVWVAAHLSKWDGELACDTAAVRTLGNAERYAYGRTLLALSDPRKRGGVIRNLLSTAADATSMSAEQIKLRIHTLSSPQKAARLVGVFALAMSVILAVSGFTGIRQQRLADSIDAPSYVIEEALLWSEDEIAGVNAMLSDALRKNHTITDWQITALTYVQNEAPVAGIEIEIWNMELSMYNLDARGVIQNDFYGSGVYDGSGRIIRSHYYLVFDAQEKLLLQRHENTQDTPYVPTDDNRRVGTAMLDDFMPDLKNRLRFLQSSGSMESDLRAVGPLSLRSVYGIASGEAKDPYHYVDGICYKAELVSSEETYWGEKQLWRVIVNETGEVCGYAVYYPDYDDIAVSDHRGRVRGVQWEYNNG